MSLTGTGVIAIWHDIRADRLQDFYEWHNREHIPERVGIEGFQRGRRYGALAGAPEFFTLYNVRDARVLAGPAYHARLNDPTPWTLRAVGYFSNEARSLCEVKASQGVGSGGVIATLRFDCELDRDDATMEALTGPTLAAVAATPAIAAMHVCRADLDTSRRRSAEQKDRGDNLVPRWVVLVEGGTLAAVQEAVAAHLGPALLAALGVREAACSVYGLQHDLVKGGGHQTGEG
jgi:hypothetical protein